MCGIVGTYDFNNHRPTDRAKLVEATDLVRHRGPDGDGYYYDDQAGVGLGHRRLSIIDLSTGDQPLSNEDGTLWIVFNGELYNYKELRDDLKSRGHVFKTQSDTEVIVHAYEEFGRDCPKKFNGIFAFAIWDSKSREIFLARDHFGVKPLYYAVQEGVFYFASEMKSILHLGAIKREIDEEALALCLTYRFTPPPRTLLQGVRKLPAAHSIVVGAGYEPVVASYWDKTIHVDRSKSESQWLDLLRSQFQTAVRRQMMADVPIGISLSGGVDSGAIVSLMTKFEGRGVHAFTVQFEGGKPEDDETSRAKANAARYGARFYHRVVTADDYMKFMEKYLWHLEEPVGNESAIAYYFVAEMAKGTVKVLLNGQGADELFAGYDRYVGVYYSSFLPFLNSSIISSLTALPFSLNRKNQFLRYGEFFKKKSTTEKIASATSILTERQRRMIFSENLLLKADESVLEMEIASITDARIEGTVLEKLLFYDMFASLSENLLLSEDKMAMAASIEARVPFLDIDFATTALSIPASLKIRNFSGKYIHKKMCEGFLPGDIVYQRKIGFNNPVEEWLKKSLGQELMDYVDSSDSISRKHLNRSAIAAMYDEHKKGEADHQRFLFLLLSVEKWAQRFLHQ